MKKISSLFTACVLVGLFLVILGGCGVQSPELNTLDYKYQEEIVKLQSLVKTKNGAKMKVVMESILALVAEMEAEDFEGAEVLSPPADFPMNLIYPGGKILTIKEETTEGRILQEVEIKTLDQLGVVKNFYNNQANDPAWKLTSQTNGALDVRYECWQENKKLIMVITGNPFTKLVKVRIIYEQLE